MRTVSFRDPDGFIFPAEEKICRVVNAGAATRLFSYLNKDECRALIGAGKLIGTVRASRDTAQMVLDSGDRQFQEWESDSLEILEHEAIWFPGYPTEWTKGMLRAAALTTLDLAEALLRCGLGLKDATPWNVLFRNTQPVWVDTLSLEERVVKDPIWRPLSQFLETFLYPLLLAELKATAPHEMFLLRREGVPAEMIYERLGPAGRLRPSVFAWVTLPHWLSRWGATPEYSRGRTMPDARSAQTMLGRMFASLRRVVEGISPAFGKTTEWGGYSEKCHYPEDDRRIKRQFCHEMLSGLKPGRILDLGCNDGEYSEMAARLGHQVVAVDADPGVINRLWLRTREKELAIQPLIVNVANPTAGVGWRNSETKDFVSRATGKFDSVMALALLHHLTVTERVPLGMTLDLIADLTRHAALVEYVSPQDPMYQSLLRGREDLHRDDSRELFESKCRRRFEIVASLPILGGRRCLYSLVRKG